MKILYWMCMIAVLNGCKKESEQNSPDQAKIDSLTIRVATFNVEDIRTDDLKNPGHPRLKRITAIIQKIRPGIILINEIAYDQPGSPGYKDDDMPGQNGNRLAENFLSVAQETGLKPLRYKVFMAPSNTGINSGFDLNNDGKATGSFPPPPGADQDGQPGKQTPEGRNYGNDSWGFGTFPGQYALALLVNEDFEILKDEVRTFQRFPWSAMPGALLPIDPPTQKPWYSQEEVTRFPLSSKSHWDVPVKLPNGSVLHLLCSHPTPPAFDGEEQRNKRRNHDEIRFWADYINGADYIVDDGGYKGGLKARSSFVILGDLNADPTGGASLDNPIQKFLLSHARINGEFIPRAPAMESADADNTSTWGHRVDYVLPSTDLTIVRGGIWRDKDNPEAQPVSDHFPVWIDLAVTKK